MDGILTADASLLHNCQYCPSLCALLTESDILLLRTFGTDIVLRLWRSSRCVAEGLFPCRTVQGSRGSPQVFLFPQRGLTAPECGSDTLGIGVVSCAAVVFTARARSGFSAY